VSREKFLRQEKENKNNVLSLYQENIFMALEKFLTLGGRIGPEK